MATAPKTTQKTLRLPTDVIREMERIARESGKDFSSVARELLEEAIKLERCPGIAITEGVAGKRARIAGTGIEIWEVIANYKALKEDFGRLSKTYHWLTEPQLRAALGYYSSYPEEVDRLISENDSWTPERLRAQHPHIAAAGR